MANGSFAGGSGAENDPYLIEDAWDLDAVRNDLSAHYKLINDIDLDISPFNEGNGWTPISDFYGSLDGQGHSIINLYIKRTSGRTGLFSNNYGTIENLILQGEANGVDYTGGLVGSNQSEGIIRNSIFNFVVDGGLRTGVIAGNNNGLIENCYAMGENLGTQIAGGFVGQNWDGKIRNSYSTTKVSQKNFGFTGRVSTGNGIVNCFWDTDTSGASSTMDSAAVGLTTQEMQTAQTFINAGWHEEKLEDGTPVWILQDGRYPKLWFEKEPVKTLILNGNEYKKFDDNGWQTVSITLPTSQQFQEEGMEDLSILDRKVQPVLDSPLSMSKEVLGEGKVFKASVDLKKYFDLRKLEVK